MSGLQRVAKVAWGLAVVAVAATATAVAQAPAPRAPREPEYKSTLAADHPAIRAIAPAGDPVGRLAAALVSGATTLPPRAAAGGHLPAVLEALGVPVDAQMLVFSKTSVQAARISPSRPRAIYFSDDVMVAHVPEAPDLELIGVDPARGPVFYVLTERAGASPQLVSTATCLRCHHGPNTAGVPGVYVGSVIPGPGGAPLRDDTAIITDHASPFDDRWGGWYVTAQRLAQPGRSNAVASNPADPASLVREVPAAVPALFGFFDPRPYLVPTSDIVALMVFEHQTQMTNLLTRLAWQAQLVAAGATRAEAPAGLDADLDDLVDYMLFVGEAPITSPIAGVSTFARTFAARGPRDPRGRSLREFDLTTRLFRYPLSYLIHGRQFAALPREVRHRVLGRLGAILAAGTPDPRHRHLTADLRIALREIVRATVSDLPADW